jgi:hypothetical protein
MNWRSGVSDFLKILLMALKFDELQAKLIADKCDDFFKSNIHVMDRHFAPIFWAPNNVIFALI